MRIGILCHSSCGGSGRIGTELAIKLAQRGHRVHLFTRTVPFGYRDNTDGVILHPMVSDDEDKIHPATLHVDWTNEEFNRFLDCLLQVIDEEGLDVLHFHYAIPFAFIAEEIASRLKHRAPLIIGTLHGTDVCVHGRHPASRTRLAPIIRNLDGLTTVSFNFAHVIAEVFGLKNLPEVIPNFVDLSRFRPRVRNERNGRKVKIVHVSNFRPIKDPMRMASIFLGIREKREAELWLIGEGPELKKLQTLFKEKGAEHDVYQWGLCQNVAPLLSRTDLLVMPSLYESFCLSALEAMACGVPVLATDVGGIPEVVIHGKTGLLFSVGDDRSAVDLALELLSDSNRYEEMRNEAMMHAQRFDRDRIVLMYEALYKRLAC